MIIASCCQFAPEFGAVEVNLRKIADLAGRSAAQLVVFPELATSGYEILDRSELRSLAFSADDKDILKPLLNAARENDTHIVFGFPELTSQNIFNSAALIEPSGEIFVYRKLHLFDREKELFTPGDKPPFVVDTAIGKIGLMICFDWVFPEVSRSLALKGAQVICHPSNLVLSYCQRAMFARSVENGVFTITCNRIGSEERTGRKLIYTGQSQILSNRGVMLVQASLDQEEIICADINPSDADNKMLTKHNSVIIDRRPEFYKDII